MPPLLQLIGAWTAEYFLIATTMLVIGLFAVLSWESTFPDRRDVLADPRQSWISWIPSYWFVGLYQQLSGSLHPALAPFARRAWIGLIAAIVQFSVRSLLRSRQHRVILAFYAGVAFALAILFLNAPGEPQAPRPFWLALESRPFWLALESRPFSAITGWRARIASNSASKRYPPTNC